ncbi:MAG: hypothetical protein IPK57_02675 [Chitinophagaceae bacterium]|nr:hypothetical protein [Chitinophagaceae bacterium]
MAAIANNTPANIPCNDLDIQRDLFHASAGRALLLIRCGKIGHFYDEPKSMILIQEFHFIAP